jgi:signal transduction histidine kinase
MSHSPLPQLLAKADRILVVDDLPDNCFLVQTLLQEEGYVIDIAYSGKAALDYIERSPPDLVLLDVMMPGMDGYEVTRLIRNSRLPFIPILLITADDRSSVVRGLNAGADEFIRKPVEFDELVARVRSLLRLKHIVDERDLIMRQREDFVSRLTHDLRTPLVAADRMLNLFLQGALGDMTPQMQQAIVTMLHSNKNLLTMVNTLLEVYRYEAGRKTLVFAPVDVPQIVQEVMEELRPLANEKGLGLNLEFPGSGDRLANRGVVNGDRLELRRVVTNLIGNALKFTDSGSITVRLFSTAASNILVHNCSQSLVVLQVEDTGPGISAEEQSTLFEGFRQGSHKRAGCGLGLHLSRYIVEAHRGRIDVQSQVGKGSLLTVHLPLADNN